MKITLIHSYFAHGIHLGSLFVVMFLATRYGENGLKTYGYYTLIASTAGFVSTLLASRTGEAVTRFYTMYKSQSKVNMMATVIRYGLVTDLIFATIVVSIIFSTSSYVDQNILKESSNRSAIIIYGFIAGIEILIGTPFSVFQSEYKFKIINNIRILRDITGIGLVGVLFLGIGSRTVYGLISAQLFSSMLALCLSIYFLYQILKTNRLNIIAKAHQGFFLKYLKYNFATFTSTMLKAGHKNLDKVVLGLITNAEIVGLYQVLHRFTFPVNFISAPFQMLYYPRIVELYSNAEKIKLLAFINDIDLKLMKMWLLLLTPIVILAPFAFIVLDIEWRNQYFVYLFLLMISALEANLQWWARSLANTINPMLSVWANGLASVLLFSMVLGMTYLWNLNGYIGGILVLTTLMLVFWRIVLFRKLS